MKDKLINALATEYEAVYMINLEEDTYEAVKTLKNSPAMLSSSRWSEAGKAFVEECSEDSKAIINLFADPQFLKTALAKEDYQECTFRHISSDSRWRKATVHVIERDGDVPKLILMTVSMIDKLTYQKERMYQKILSAKDMRKNPEDSNDSELPVYKMVLSNDTEDENH